MLYFRLRHRGKKIKVLMVMLLIFMTLYIFVAMVYMKHYLNDKKVVPHVKLDYVIVHLDLKGSPPKLSYLELMLPLLKDHGVNGLLIEYEDMFPYEGKLVNLRASNAYKKDELGNFLALAFNSGFEIIPLIQTFGHLEYALKLGEFKHLRELPLYPDSICPSKKESQEFITTLLTQVINFHKNIVPLKHFHIGCDEVFHLNLCRNCLQRNLTNTDMFYSHFNFVTEIVLNLSPSTTILFWEDMLRHVKPKKFADLQFHQTISVYWDYDVKLKNIHPELYKYQQKFKQLWVATAFKGADGRSRSVPVMSRRFHNHWLWMKFILNYGNKASLYSFKGIILTGWSRITHMDPPCEVLPVAIPSLILNLIVIKAYVNGSVVGDVNEQMFIQQYIQKDFNSALKCQDALNESLDSFNSQTCYYDGSELYTILEYISKFEQVYKEKILNDQEDLVKIKDFKLGYIDMVLVVNLMNWFAVALNELRDLEYSLIKAMSKYFDNTVVDEYLFFKLRTTKKEIREFLQFLNSYFAVRDHTWPPRLANISFH